MSHDPTGWTCPKCGTVYGPHVSTCAPCSAKKSSDHNFPPRLDIPDDCAIRRIEVTCEDPGFERTSCYPHYPFPAWARGGAR